MKRRGVVLACVTAVLAFPATAHIAVPMRRPWRTRMIACVRTSCLLVLVGGGTSCASRPRGHADDIERRGAGPGAVGVTLVSDEADAALALLRKRRAGTPPDATDWARLFGTRGYRRLKTRELGMRRAFTDSAFRAFVLSDSLLARLPALEVAVADYRRLDVGAQAARALRYLPPGATIHATLYLTVKPRPNSFVWADSAERSVVLYVDPARPRAAVEHDVVAHELHHIGYAETCDAGGVRAGAAAATPGPASPTPAARARAQDARTWLGAFGEGLAMLAAAGGPDAHPHARSPDSVRARWDRDYARWRDDLPHIEQFLSDVAAGRLADPDAVRAAAATFYGDAQGPWYTVGYAMAVTVERAYGRERLVGAICDPARLLTLYNAAARAANARQSGAADQLPLWSDALLAALGGA